ncbi:MAG: DUF3934 family protein [Bacillota bacterium]
MSKSKGGGTGKGTGKKGWNRWQKSAKKKAAKPYTSKGTKHGNGSEKDSDSK